MNVLYKYLEKKFPEYIFGYAYLYTDLNETLETLCDMFAHVDHLFC